MHSKRVSEREVVPRARPYQSKLPAIYLIPHQIGKRASGCCFHFPWESHGGNNNLLQSFCFQHSPSAWHSPRGLSTTPPPTPNNARLGVQNWSPDPQGPPQDTPRNALAGWVDLHNGSAWAGEDTLWHQGAQTQGRGGGRAAGSRGGLAWLQGAWLPSQPPHICRSHMNTHSVYVCACVCACVCVCVFLRIFCEERDSHLWISVNGDSFPSSSSIWMYSIYFSCPVALAGTSNTMINGSGKSRYPCLVPDFNGQAFILSPLCMILSVGFYRNPLLGWESSFLFLLCWVFLIMKGLDF